MRIFWRKALLNSAVTSYKYVFFKVSTIICIIIVSSTWYIDTSNKSKSLDIRRMKIRTKSAMTDKILTDKIFTNV